MSVAHDSFLDHLPVEWNFDRFKDVVSLRNEKTDEPSSEEDYLELEDLESGSGRILSRGNTLTVGSAVTLFKKGDVLFGKLRPYLEKYWVAEFDGKCTGEILAFKPQRIVSRFLFYCLGSRWFIERCNALAYGAKMPRVSWPTQLSQFNLPLPPLPEQQRIAAYLDTNCAAIDAAVIAKRSQLETLHLLRKSILHFLFTSHGDAPIERVKDLAAKITSGVTPDGGASGYHDSGIPLLRSQNVHFDGLRLDDVAFISDETHEGMMGSQVKPRDVLLNITGASIGRCTFVPDGFGEGNVNQHVCIIRPGPRVDHRFLAVFLSSPMGQDQIFSAYTGASRQGLSHSDLGLIRIPFPKLAVQRQIVGKIEQQDGKHRNIYTCIESQIATLTAYRKSLIHECVTGQRRITEADVRRAQCRSDHHE